MFSVGQTVGVRCEIQGGAFSNEYLVSIETDEGILSGFADAEDVRPHSKDPSKGVIRATVVEVSASLVKVRIHGSFFTIAGGTTHVSYDWANRNLEVSA